MNILSAICMFALWSTIFSLGKHALGFLSPLWLTALRFSLAGLLLLVVSIIKKEKWPVPSRALFLYGFLAFYISNVLEFWGLQSLSAANTCFIYSLTPFLTALFSYFYHQERLFKRQWLGICIGFAAILPIIVRQSEVQALWRGFVWMPTLAVVGATTASVYGWILLRGLLAEEKSSPLIVNGIGMLLGGTMAAIHAALAEQSTPLCSTPITWHALAGELLLMILISNLICYNWYGFLLKRMPPTVLSFLGLFSPIFASLNAQWILGEPFHWILLPSTALLSFGLLLLVSKPKQQVCHT